MLARTPVVSVQTKKQRKISQMPGRQGKLKVYNGIGRLSNSAPMLRRVAEKKKQKKVTLGVNPIFRHFFPQLEDVLWPQR
jgi:hypothetical protein